MADKEATELRNPTRTMVDFFEKRTLEHINRVIKFMRQLDGFGEFSAEELNERARLHDQDKYADPDMVLPYVWVTEYHRVNNLEGSVDDDLQRQYDLSADASGKHVEQNRHHPEAHESIDQMTNMDLAEMVADWTAMAEELDQGSARGWADQNVGQKWEFTDEQTEFIYSAIDWLEEQDDQTTDVNTTAGFTFRGHQYIEATVAASRAATSAHESTGAVTTSPRESNARRQTSALRDSVERDREAPGGLDGGSDAVGPPDSASTRSDREPHQYGGEQVGTDTAATTRAAVREEKMIKSVRIKTAQDPILDEPELVEPTGVGADGVEPSESEMVDELEEEPGAQWRDLYLQPIIRAIRNRFDLEEGQVKLLGPKKKVPFGSDTLGFDITGHVRFEQYEPPADDYGEAPYRFMANVDPNGELQLPVEVMGA